jgi:hypothetical protein
LKKRISLRGFLQEKTTSRLLFERTRTRIVSPIEAKEIRRFLNSTMKCSGLIDTGPTGLPSDTTTSHGPWLGPQTEAGKGVAT